MKRFWKRFINPSFEFLLGLAFSIALTTSFLGAFTAIAVVVPHVDPHLVCTLEGRINAISAPREGEPKHQNETLSSHKEAHKGTFVCISQEFRLMEEES